MWGVESIEDYLDPEVINEREKLSERDHYNEYLMTSLRRMEGVNYSDLVDRFGERRLRQFEAGIDRWIESGDLLKDQSGVVVAPISLLRSDLIISSLFDVD